MKIGNHPPGTNTQLNNISLASTTQILGQVFALIAAKANVLAYNVVFQTAGISMACGAVSALFIHEAKREVKHGEHEHTMIEI